MFSIHLNGLAVCQSRLLEINRFVSPWLKFKNENSYIWSVTFFVAFNKKKKKRKPVKWISENCLWSTCLNHSHTICIKCAFAHPFSKLLTFSSFWFCIKLLWILLGRLVIFFACKKRNKSLKKSNQWSSTLSVMFCQKTCKKKLILFQTSICTTISQ